jgi:ferrous iron transport protein A
MLKPKNAVPLHLTSTGDVLRIASMPHGTLRAQFVRLGIHEGEKIKCLERLPGGTVVIQKNRQQIAIGHQLAKQIMVVVLGDKEK